MVDDYEYEEGTLNEIWQNFELKEDEVNDRLVLQRKDTARTEIAEFASDGSFAAPLDLDAINNVILVDEASDLPDASGGTRTLADDTMYLFTDFVTDSNSLEFGAQSVVIGFHHKDTGYFYTGTGAAIVANDVTVGINGVQLHAPNGEIFDAVDANTDEEFFVEDVEISDRDGSGNINSLGTIEGYQGVDFVHVEFEDFDAGLTFTGTSEQILFSNCKFKNVTNTGVTILTFDANCTTEIVEITNGYINDVQADTIVQVSSSATISEIFQYRGMTHDETVNVGQILTGDAGPEVIGYRVTDSYPLPDSAVVGELSADASGTVTIGAQDTYTTIDLTSSLGGESERVSNPSPGVLQYDGKKIAKITADAKATVDTGGNTVGLVISKNGTPQTTSEMTVDGSAADATFVASSSVESLQTGDTIEAQIKNVDGTTDLTVQSFSLNFSD